MRTTVTTVCGVTCLRANSSPADCASRRPSELSLPKMSTTRRVAAAAGAAPGSAAGVATVAAAGPGAPADGASRLNGAERGQLLGDTVLQHLDLPLLQVGDELALLVAHDEVERDDLGARHEARSRCRRLGRRAAPGRTRATPAGKHPRRPNPPSASTCCLLMSGAHPDSRIIAETRAQDTLSFRRALERGGSRPCGTVGRGAGPFRRARRRLHGHEEQDHDDRSADPDRPPDRSCRFSARASSRFSASPCLRRSSREKRRHSPSWAPGS